MKKKPAMEWCVTVINEGEEPDGGLFGTSLEETTDLMIAVLKSLKNGDELIVIKKQ